MELSNLLDELYSFDRQLASGSNAHICFFDPVESEITDWQTYGHRAADVGIDASVVLKFSTKLDELHSRVFQTMCDLNFPPGALAIFNDAIAKSKPKLEVELAKWKAAEQIEARNAFLIDSNCIASEYSRHCRAEHRKWRAEEAA
jgi:hypothetical protein